MKIYILVNCGVEHTSILGVYIDKNRAEQDMAFVAAEEIKKACGDDTFQERWVKIEDVWYNQTRRKSQDEVWGEWPKHDPKRYWFGDKIRIRECDAIDLTLQERVDAINAWQSNNQVHPLTCGNDSSHPHLNPYYDFSWPGVGIQCVHKLDANTWCGWQQKPNHPILEIIYASFLSNRASSS